MPVALSRICNRHARSFVPVDESSNVAWRIQTPIEVQRMNELQELKAKDCKADGRDLAMHLGVQSAKKWCKRMTERRLRQ